MEEDKRKVVNLFSSHSALENAQLMDSQPSPGIQFNNTHATTFHVSYNTHIHKATDSCAELHQLKNEISRLESLLKNK
jgi:hypothetical protein